MHKTIMTSAVALSAAAFLLSASPMALAAPAQEPNRSVSAAPDHQNLTIYPRFGIVQQTNPIDVTPGANSIRLDGIAAQYEPSSLVVVNVTGVPLKVKDVTYQPANLNLQSILANSVGSIITVKSPAGDVVTGKLLSYTEGTLTIAPSSPQGTSGWRSISDPKDVQSASMPNGLSATPSLTLNAETGVAGHGDLQILYKANGLSWGGRYAVTYDEKNGTVDLSSSVAIENHSGTNFKNAGIKVVSGDIRDNSPRFERSFAAPMAAAAPGGASFDNAAVGSVGEAKIYTLATSGVDLKDTETKQVPLYGAKGVPVERVYSMSNPHSGADYKVSASTKLLTTNDKAHHLGQPLPNGTVKYYQNDPSGELQLSAAGGVVASEPGDKITFDLGTTDDVKSTWSLTHAVEGKRQPDGSVTPSTYDWSVKLTNSKDRDVDVKVYDTAGRQTVTKSSQPFHADGGQQYTTVHLPAHGSATLTYTTVTQNQ